MPKSGETMVQGGVFTCIMCFAAYDFVVCGLFGKAVAGSTYQMRSLQPSVIVLKAGVFL